MFNFFGVWEFNPSLFHKCNIWKVKDASHKELFRTYLVHDKDHFEMNNYQNNQLKQSFYWEITQIINEKITSHFNITPNNRELLNISKELFVNDKLKSKIIIRYSDNEINYDWKYEYNENGNLSKCTRKYILIGAWETDMDEYYFDNYDRLIAINTTSSFHSKSYISKRVEYLPQKMIIIQTYLNPREQEISSRIIQYLSPEGKVERAEYYDFFNKLNKVSDFFYNQDGSLRMEHYLNSQDEAKANFEIDYVPLI